MASIVFLIEQTAVALYIFIAVGIFWYFYQWRVARRSYRLAQFELERDFATRRRADAFTAVILLIELGFIISGFQRVIAPTVRADMDMEALLAEEVITDGNFATNTPPAVLATPDLGEFVVTLPGANDGPVVFISPEPTATFPGTLIPTSDINPSRGCDSPNSLLEIPRHGQIVTNVIPIRGSAYLDAFEFAEYHLEIGVPTRGEFVYRLFDVGELELREVSDMSQFNPAPYQSEPGIYAIRLMVFDIDRVLRSSCEVLISIQPPLPTPTPLGG